MRPVLALELSTEGIILHELSYDGKWRQLAAASLNDPFLPKKMAAMRVTAKASQGRFFKNELWVPEQQIISTSAPIDAEEPADRTAQAQQALRDDASIPAGDYVVQVGETDKNGTAQIAAIERSILQETERFAKGYGFGSDGITSAARIAGFHRQPYFSSSNSVALPVDTRKIGFFTGAMIAVAAMLGGGWWLYNNIELSPDPTTDLVTNENRILAAAEDPRAPIRPTNIAVPVARVTPGSVSASNAEIVPSIPDIVSPEFSAMIEQQAISSELTADTTPERGGALSAVQAPQEAPIWANIGRPDALPGASQAEVIAAPTPDDLPLEDTAVQPEPIIATNTPSALEVLQMLPPIVISGLPDLTPELRSGYNLAEVPDDPVVVAPIVAPVQMTLEELQSLPPIVLNTPPAIIPIGRPILEAATTAPTVTASTPTTPLSLEELQNLPPVVLRERPAVIPLGRPTTDTPQVIASIPTTPLSLEELQNLPPIVLSERPRVLPLARPEIETPPVEIVAPPPQPEEVAPPLDPVTDAARIALLQAAPAVVQQGRPGILPQLRGGIEIGGVGTGVIIDTTDQPDAARLRPLSRPSSIEIISLINDPDVSQQAVTNTLAPPQRASNFGSKVEAMMATFEQNARETPRFTDTPREVVVPTRANVAREATIVGGIDLRATSLIGVYGKPGDYKALIRQRGGKYTMVKVGDTIAGWRITAIAESTVRIQKGSRNEVLRLPG